MPSPLPPSPSPQPLTTHGGPVHLQAPSHTIETHAGADCGCIMACSFFAPVPTGSLILDELPVLRLGPRCVIGCSKLSRCIRFHLPVSLPPWPRDVAPRSCPAPRLKVHVRAVACVGTAGPARRPSPPAGQKPETRISTHPPSIMACIMTRIILDAKPARALANTVVSYTANS
jgi:hypothetical protein